MSDILLHIETKLWNFAIVSVFVLKQEASTYVDFGHPMQLNPIQPLRTPFREPEIRNVVIIR